MNSSLASITARTSHGLTQTLRASIRASIYQANPYESLWGRTLPGQRRSSRGHWVRSTAIGARRSAGSGEKGDLFQVVLSPECTQLRSRHYHHHRRRRRRRRLRRLRRRRRRRRLRRRRRRHHHHNILIHLRTPLQTANMHVLAKTIIFCAMFLQEYPNFLSIKPFHLCIYITFTLFDSLDVHSGVLLYLLSFYSSYRDPARYPFTKVAFSFTSPTPLLHLISSFRNCADLYTNWCAIFLNDIKKKHWIGVIYYITPDPMLLCIYDHIMIICAQIVSVTS